MTYYQQGLGALDPNNLAVKQYGTVWGSIDSPEADAVLKNIQTQLNRFGISTKVDGLIGSGTLAGVKKVVAAYQSIPFSSTSAALTARDESTQIGHYTASVESLAKGGYWVSLYLKDLADNYLKYYTAPTSGTTPTPTPTHTTSLPSYPTTVPPMLPPSPITAGGGMLAGMSGGMKVAMGGLVVGFAYVIGKNLKKGKGGRSSSRSNRSSRRRR